MQPQWAQLLPTRAHCSHLLTGCLPIGVWPAGGCRPAHGQLLQWLSGYEWGQHRCCGCTWDRHLIQSWGVQEASQTSSSEMTLTRDVPGAGRMIFNLQLVLNGKGKTRVFIKVRQMAAGGQGEGSGDRGQGAGGWGGGALHSLCSFGLRDLHPQPT